MADRLKHGVGFTLYWEIENFLMLILQDERCLASPTFKVAGLNNTRWCLKITAHPDLSFNCELKRQDPDGVPNSKYLDYEVAVIERGTAAWSSNTLVLRGPDKEGKTIVNAYQYARLKSFNKDILTIRCRIWHNNDVFRDNELCSAKTKFEVEKRSSLFSIKGFNLDLGNSIDITYWKSLDDPTIKHVCNSDIPADQKVQVRFFLPGRNKATRLTFSVTILSAFAETVLHQTWWCGLDYIESEKSLGNSAAIGPIKPEHLQNLLLMLKFDFAIFTGKVSHTMQNCSQLIEVGEKDSNALYRGLQTVDKPGTRVRQSQSAQSGEHEVSAVIFDIYSKSLDAAIKNLCEEYQVGTNCDATLVVGNERYAVHRQLLCAKSRAFKTYLEISRKTEAEFRLPSWYLDIIPQLLSCLYMDTIIDLQFDNALSLLSLAHAYQIDQLRELCLDFIHKHLDLENLLDALTLLEDIDDKKFINIVCAFCRKVKGSKTWNSIQELHPQLASFVYRVDPSLVYRNRDKLPAADKEVKKEKKKKGIRI